MIFLELEKVDEDQSWEPIVISAPFSMPKILRSEVIMIYPNKPLPGRRLIMTDEKSITKENIVKVVSNAYSEHITYNRPKEHFLELYKRGDQPILNREKDIRPEINEKIAENNASKIVDVHLGYDFANPITLVQRERKEIEKDEKDNKIEDGTVAQLNKMFADQDKASKDLEMGNNMLTMGLGYFMAYPSRDDDEYSPFEIMVLNPETTFVVYTNDAYREPLLAVTYFEHEDGSVTATCYSKNYFFELNMLAGLTNFNDEIKALPNPVGEIPIIEFSMTDRMGVFEKALPILDALNTIGSDRVNSIVQFVQSLLWFHNCELDKENQDAIKNGDKPNPIIFTKNEDGKQANIEYISKPLNQTETQSLVDYYHSQLLQITSTPSWQEASGGSTTGAMQLSNGWQCLELSAKVVETKYTRSARKLLKVVKKIIEADKTRDYLSELKKVDMADIDIKFSRNKTYDLISKTNALVSLLNAGVDGLTAFTIVSLFPDPQAAWFDSKEIIEAMQEKLAQKEEKAENTQNIIPNANAATDESGNGGTKNDAKDISAESLQPSKVAMVED